MHVSPEDLARSGALLYDLEEEIKPRYLFLERAGLYQHPSPKSIGVHAAADPSVGDVLNTDLIEYLALACGSKLTAEEYNTFLSVLLAERDAVGQMGLDDHGYEDDGERERVEEMKRFKRNAAKEDDED